jgi:chemotaxis protein MotB
MAKGKKGEGNTIVIKRIEEGGHRHHGGAWKVAYADFVTAMMAFFLLMWLINATTAEQRRGLADYFNPTTPISSSTTGSGLPFGGMTINSAGNLARDTGAVRLERGQRPVQQEEQAQRRDARAPVVEQRRGRLEPRARRRAASRRNRPRCRLQRRRWRRS